MICFSALSVLVLASIATAFPPYHSLAGLSEAELELIIPTLEIRSVDPPPGPLKDNGTKLVNDKDHPWEPLRPGDIRGPCPGLNTLASHGVCQEYPLFPVFPISETISRVVSSA